MAQIPVYVFTGFLDSGKTKFIQETLEDPRFNAGERTLLLVFEEGEEEYDFSVYPHQTVYLEVLDQQTVTPKELQALAKKHKAQRRWDIRQCHGPQNREQMPNPGAGNPSNSGSADVRWHPPSPSDPTPPCPYRFVSWTS